MEAAQTLAFGLHDQAHEHGRTFSEVEMANRRNAEDERNAVFSATL